MVDMSGAGDAELVRRVLGGDSAAFAGLVARYRDRLGRYAVRMLGNRADAEDALQETFVRAYRSLGRCTDAERFGAWVFGILVNRCRTLGAQRARRQRIQVADETALLRAASRDDPVGQQALREVIATALAQLAPTPAGGVLAQVRGGAELRRDGRPDRGERPGAQDAGAPGTHRAAAFAGRHD